MTKYQFILLSTLVVYLHPFIVAVADDPVAVPTFHCLGLSWSPANGAKNIECQAKYRIAGASDWKTAMPLWFDERNREYRGSIVNLASGTIYEIQLTLQGAGKSAAFTASTWKENFPIAQTISLPETSNSTLVIAQSGAANGYILYTPAAGKTATIEVNNNKEVCIDIQPNVSHVVIRGLILKGAQKHGINLNKGVHDVVIEDCDISGWGTSEPDGWGVNYQSAVFAEKDTQVERIIVQKNRMHHPRADANSWTEYRTKHRTYHPRGPQAVAFFDSKGNHVIRDNEIYSDDNHYFNDALGYGANFSFQGFPNRDSDIYGNYISHCWDDGIESEGANRNVRIWGNYLDRTYMKIAITVTSVGPLYIWRNIANTSRKSGKEPSSDKYGRGAFIKAGGVTEGGTWYGSGRTYIFHNTVLQAPAPPGQIYPLGCDGGIIGAGGPFYETISRNNILTVYQESNDAFRDRTNSCTNDFDYDLYTGKIGNACSSRPHQTHGIAGAPRFDADNGPGEFALAPAAPGFDAGVIIPNFNDDYAGNGPDPGAFEAGSPAMKFGAKPGPPAGLKIETVK